ncbi:uncharacterized protein N7479_009115 [Penicillium vulpinum]|uniref:uncharacterized protein n=1 Tax=Penicillium vulpinum TaxID=29845 RepID=UPI0025472281|nr:uncharacterized protein N7479_009115 [Penicillium vulpinum]KAJ5950702.1 hypothetical protein N7479_009115 [Penicillium vulpinum]
MALLAHEFDATTQQRLAHALTNSSRPTPTRRSGPLGVSFMSLLYMSDAPVSAAVPLSPWSPTAYAPLTFSSPL